MMIDRAHDSWVARLGAGALAGALGLAAAPAGAQNWRIAPSVGTTITTNNSGNGSGDSVSETLIELSPRLVMEGRGARFRLNGDLSLDALTYLAGTQSNRVLPQARVALNVTPVERWFYVDASLAVDQTATNPYALQGTSVIVTELVTTRRTRLGPYVQHDFTPSLSLLARSDNLWTKRSGVTTSVSADRDSHVESDTVRLEQKPLPLGGWFEYSRDRTNYAIASVSTLDIDAIRAGLTYGPSAEIQFGLTVGTERTRLALERSTDNVYGINLDWRPTERSRGNMTVERRFFGTGGSLEFTHRSPFMAFAVRAARQPVTQPDSILLTPPNGDIAGLLDAIYTTRVPDPAERAELVRNIIATLGLTPITSGPVEVFANYVQLQETASLNAAFIGRLTTVSFGVFGLRSTELRRSADAGSALTAERGADNAQIGISLDVNRRVSEVTTMNLGVQGAHIRGLGVSSGNRSTEKSLAWGMNHTLSPRTSLFAGLRRRVLTSSATVPTKETAVFAGAQHRY